MTEKLNAPSEITEQEAFKRGYQLGFVDGLKAQQNNNCQPPVLSRSFEAMGEKG